VKVARIINSRILKEGMKKGSEIESRVQVPGEKARLIG
jgi:hypothetical protein